MWFFIKGGLFFCTGGFANAAGFLLKRAEKCADADAGKGLALVEHIAAHAVLRVIVHGFISVRLHCISS